MPARRGTTHATRLGALCAALGAVACNSLFYQPSQAQFAPKPANAQELWLEAPGGVALSAWLLRSTAGPPHATFVQFHGNAANMTGHVRHLSWVTERGYDLFTFDYRGYGISEGEPSRRGVHQDAVAALRFVDARARESGAPLVLYGQSLGGAVMLRALATVRPSHVAAVVVESSFHSYQDAAAGVLFRVPPLLPFAGLAYTLVSDELSPAPFVATVAPTPLLVVHGDADPVIDVRFGRALYALARHPKELWVIRGGGHVDAMRREGGRHRERLLAFVETALRRARSAPVAPGAPGPRQPGQSSPDLPGIQ